MDNDIEKIVQQIVADPASSNWIKKAISDLSQRDPVDVISDIEMLYVLYNKKLESLGLGPVLLCTAPAFFQNT